MLDLTSIRALTLDLDDTLWPVWPAIEQAESVLLLWLREHAAKTARMFPTTNALRALRVEVEKTHPNLRHDLSALRIESIRQALRQAGDDENLAIPAFEIFFAQRQRVTLYDDALPALEFLAARWPLVAVTNGNADVQRVGIGHFFQDSFNVARTGHAKPDAEIFRCAAQALQLPMSAILHVGDDAALDAAGAQAAGMQAVWLNRGEAAWPLAQPAPVTVPDLQALCALLSGVSTTP